MILEKQTESLVLEEGVSQESIGMTLDMDSAQILMQMLSKNLYADAIGSAVRECASNALDSHRRSKTEDPIIVTFKANKESNYEFTVEDFGIGLDEEDVRNIISKYGKSTKRTSETELGMMGLGFKAPLAYTSSFYFICRKDGMERKYMMYEGEDTNTIDLLYTKETKERNGVKIIIPVQYRDRHEFVRKIRQQLAYFESVFIDCDGVDNGFVITRGDLFQKSQLVENTEMHLCLDNVYYPLDFKALGITPIPISIGLRFGLKDGIFPTPNRESIRYTKEAKAIILERIGQIADFYVGKFNEGITAVTNYADLYNYFYYSSRYVMEGDHKTCIDLLLPYTKVQLKAPKIEGLKHLTPREVYDLGDNFLGEYKVKYRYQGSRFTTVNNAYYEKLSVRDWNDKVHIFEDKYSVLQKDYFRSLHDGYDYHNFIRKEKDFTLGTSKNRLSTDYNTYMSLLRLWKHPKKEWRDRIADFRFVHDMIVANFINEDKVVIPDSFIEGRKKKRVKVSTKREKLHGQITAKVGSQLERYVEGKNCKWVPTSITLDTLGKDQKKLILYGNDSIASDMDKMFTNARHIALWQLSEREIKAIEKNPIHNLMKFSTFMEGKNKPFKRMITAYIIDQLLTDYRNVFGHIEQLAPISESLSKQMTELKAYRDKWFMNGSDAVYKAMLEVAEEHKLWDMTILPTYNSVKNVLVKLPFIKIVADNAGYRSQLFTILPDLFKYHKHRIDWKNYKLSLNETITNE